MVVLFVVAFAEALPLIVNVLAMPDVPDAKVFTPGVAQRQVVVVHGTDILCAGAVVMMVAVFVVALPVAVP